MTTDSIDTSFDVRSDTPAGADPDRSSPSLKEFHRVLWGKPVPLDGSRFELEPARGGYLRHKSALGEFWMTSDSVVHTYRRWPRFGLPEIIGQIDEGRLDAFERLSYTIGEMMLFPSWTGERHWSINQARGMLTRIADRMDLTLECIRRYYANLDSPMSSTLTRYTDFFALFSDLKAYSEFFLLDDLLTDDTSSVRFFLPFDGFTRPTATPANLDEYETYMAASMNFLEARNARIRADSASALVTI